MLDELLSQLPPGIIAYGIMIPVLSLGLILYASVIRPMLNKRKKQKEEANALAASSSPAPVAPPKSPLRAQAAPVSASLDDDMPDIGLLLAEAEKAAAVPPRPTGPRQLGEAEIVLITGQSVRAREELALLRDPSDGRLIVQMPGVTYKSFASAPAAKEQFTRLMNELAKSLGQPDNAPASAPVITPPAPVVAPLPEPTPPVQAEAPAAPIEPAAPPTPTEALPPLPPLSSISTQTIPPIQQADKDTRLPGDLPRYTNMRGAELKGRGFLGRPKFEFEQIPDLNLAESIESYLQYRLNQTPGYGGRAWHVHPARDGGVRIEIDGQIFDSVSDITDPEARTFIQTSIQEWQDRQ